MQLAPIHSIMPCTTPAQTHCRNFTMDILDTTHETLQGASTCTRKIKGRVRARNRHKPITCSPRRLLLCLSWFHNNIKLHLIPASTFKTVSMYLYICIRQLFLSFHQCAVDFNDGQFSERCDVDGSFFNSDAIPIIFWKGLTSPSLRLFFLTIENDYFSIILLILRTDYFAIIHDLPDLPDLQDPAKQKQFLH